MNRIYAAVLATALALGTYSCRRPEPAVESTPSEGREKTALRPQVSCPVMGGRVDKTLYVDYEGKRVYLCCQGCVAAFKANPEKYLAVLADKGEAPIDVPAED